MRPEKAPPESIVTFHRVFTAAIPPLRADKAALGTLPTAAFQYCEPVRTASGFGWYIFPPADIHLMWDGVDVYHAEDGQWCQFSSIHLNDEFVEYWDSQAPEGLKGHSPPFLTNVFVPGIVQIWSGLLLSTAENWSALIGPLANIPQSQNFSCFEGIVETELVQTLPVVHQHPASHDGSRDRHPEKQAAISSKAGAPRMLFRDCAQAYGICGAEPQNRRHGEHVRRGLDGLPLHGAQCRFAGR